MKLKGILPFARQLIDAAVSEGDIAIDGTVGNGHDTLYLAKIVGDNGRVFGFDIQEQAIANTKERLTNEGFSDQVTLFQTSHDQAKSLIPSPYHGKIKGAIFNLGYLPGGNKEIVTTPVSTISAVEQIIEMMAPEGILVLVIYHGHPEGQIERDQLLDYVTSLDQKLVHVLNYQFINQTNNPPFIIAVEKR
ncbi:class I SAM-dependent methyltransferase [Anaerobacillus sp. MEB173]|uniref:tRNA (mnm(5)s(2)U34)-methyltransferase n=1 Tax=Anaerobacillus sp. MEB173 TaxID=3383345 RepID=UPI003F8F166D